MELAAIVQAHTVAIACFANASFSSAAIIQANPVLYRGKLAELFLSCRGRTAIESGSRPGIRVRGSGRTQYTMHTAKQRGSKQARREGKRANELPRGTRTQEIEVFGAVIGCSVKGQLCIPAVAYTAGMGDDVVRASMGWSAEVGGDVNAVVRHRDQSLLADVAGGGVQICAARHQPRMRTDVSVPATPAKGDRWLTTTQVAMQIMSNATPRRPEFTGDKYSTNSGDQATAEHQQLTQGSPAANHGAPCIVIASRSLSVPAELALRQAHSRTDLREAGLSKHLAFVIPTWEAQSAAHQLATPSHSSPDAFSFDRVNGQAKTKMPTLAARQFYDEYVITVALPFLESVHIIWRTPASANGC
ncbi:hypothetical protein OPT61_g10432 [Boeremia exigua]|uniref:Uncharacterized protein n=1 Tax=Boeremia exigua TaxID=749465 RepID=A0ACC2HPM9_9PLEO|nr:hypothetical protein OPT61_g10432 [Boeremia exigua]